MARMNTHLWAGGEPFIWACCVLVLLCRTPECIAQTSELDRRVIEALGRFENADWQQRERAFQDLLRLVPSNPSSRWVQAAVAALLNGVPTRADEIKVAVIHLLEKENANLVSGSEHQAEFRASLIGAVAEFGDKRGVNALVQNVDTGNMATHGLAALGRDAVDAVVWVARNADDTKRMAATRTLSQMLDPAVTRPEALDLATLATIKDALFRAAHDNYFWVRISSFDGLARMPGDDVTVLLTGIAERDLYTRPGGPGQGPVYFVRERAKQALLARQPRD